MLSLPSLLYWNKIWIIKADKSRISDAGDDIHEADCKTYIEVIQK
jgi:hypothetical protein